jgi:hypothetical protein
VRRPLALAVLVAGCSFPGHGGVPDGGPADGPAPPDAMGPPPIDGDVQPSLCGAGPDPTLRLCIDFEDLEPNLARDHSGRGNDAALTNVTTTTRDTSTAAHCAGDCEMRIDESSSLDFDIPATIALWVRPEGAALAENLWNHVACVADGSTLAIYVDGVFSLSTTFSSSLHTGNDQGVRLAQDLEGSGAGNETLVGAIDDVRIWSRGLSASEVCELAEQPGC